MKKLLPSFLHITLLGIFSFLLVCYSILLNYHYFDPHLYLNQAYPKPFVTRALSVWIMKFLYKKTDYNYFLIFKLMDIAWLTLSGWFFYKYINTFFINITFSRVMSLSLYLLLPFNMLLPRYLSPWYPFDYLGLLFLTMGLYFMRTKNLFWFYMVLMLGTFNRETTIVLVGMFACVGWGELSKRESIIHLIAQIGLWCTIKLFLNQYFVSSLGVPIQYQLPANLHFFSPFNTDFYRLDLADFEYLFRYVCVLSTFGFVYLLIIIFWNKLDSQFLRKTLLASIPFFLIIPIVGYVFELRLFGELTPMILMPGIYIIGKIMNDQPVISNQ